MVVTRMSGKVDKGGKLDKGGQEILVNSSYKTTNLMYNLICMINIAVNYR